MSYMGCGYDHRKRYAAGQIPGADDIFDNFPEITGKQPSKWADFIEKRRLSVHGQTLDARPEQWTAAMRESLQGEDD